jgi:peroxiredoxin
MISNSILATNFILKDQYKNDFVLKAYPENYILLSFHPLAWTEVCAQQMISLELNIARFAQLSIIPIGISIDSVPTKFAWANHLGIKQVRLLSDFWPHGNVAKMFEIFREKDGFSERANILLDKELTIIWKKIYPIAELPDIDEVIQEIKSIKEP